MMKTIALAAAALMAAGTVQAATVSPTTLESWTMGTGAGTAGRSTGSNAFVTDGSFLSLGIGGVAVFSFGKQFTGPVTITETTFGSVSAYPESATVWAATLFDGLTLGGFVKLGDITNVQAQGAGATLLADGVYKYLAVVDTTTRRPSRDGFDIDGITVTLASVPLAASAGMMTLAFGSLGAMRRRRKSRSKPATDA